MNKLEFYTCRHCGNIVTFIKNSGVAVTCCGEKMKEIIPNSSDAALEKHVPSVSAGDGRITVDVGSVSHPMTQEHLIEWVLLETDKTFLFKSLSPDSVPGAEFTLPEGEKPVAAYAMCNLHGIWKTEF